MSSLAMDLAITTRRTDFDARDDARERGGSRPPPRSAPVFSVLAAMLVATLLLWPFAPPTASASDLAVPAIRSQEDDGGSRRDEGTEEPEQDEGSQEEEQDEGSQEEDDSGATPDSAADQEDDTDGEEPDEASEDGEPGSVTAPVARRAALWRSQRARKAREIEPEEPGFLKRWILGPVRTALDPPGDFRPVVHDSHQDNQFAFGFGYEKLAIGHEYVQREMPYRKDFYFEAVMGTDGHNHVEAELDIRRIGSLRLDGIVRAEYTRHPQDEFFGPGPDSVQANESGYLLDNREVSGALVWDVPGPVSARIGGGLLRLTSSPGGDEELASVEQVFSLDQLPAFDRDLTYLRGEVGVEVDWRDEPGQPRSGGLVGVDYEHYDDIELGQFDFRRFRAEVQQYFPFFHEQRVVVLRGLAEFTDPFGPEDEVPFYLQPSLGQDDRLRGFRSFRFRDRHAVVLTAEYRWQAWKSLETALFVDAGKVFGDLDDFDLSDLETAYGIGLRLHTDHDVLFRIDLAHSREGIRPAFSFSQVF